MKTEPSQQRSINKVNDILAATEVMIEKLPLEDITPTMIAKQAEITRTSLYHFFPSKYDIFDALATRYRTELEDEVIKFFDPNQRTDYRVAWTGVARVFSDFFNKKPAAAILLLGRKANRQIRYADGSGSHLFAKVLSRLMTQHTDLNRFPLQEPDTRDIFQIVLELLTATFSLGMRKEGKISVVTREQAKEATLAYINSCLKP